MISVFLLILFQAASADVGTAIPEIRREQRPITLPPPLSYPNEMRPAVKGYMNCLTPGGNLGSAGASLESALRSRIELCERTREWAISTALALSKSKRSARAERAEIASFLDRLEAQELRNARYADDQIDVKIDSVANTRKDPPKVGDATKMSDAIRTTVVTRSEAFPIPTEFIPAVMPYLNCLIFSAGVKVMHQGRELKPTVAKGASCAAQRAKAAIDAEASLRRIGVRNAHERRSRVETFLRMADTQVAQQRPKSFTSPQEIRSEISPYVTCRLSGAACVSERARAVADADAALVRAGKLNAEERSAFISKALKDLDLFLPTIPSVAKN